VVINEVYYDAGAAGVDAKYEWIELYNNTGADVPLKDWAITDNVGARTISAEVSIPAHGFAIIAHDNSTWVKWESDHGPLPAGAVKINLGGSWPWLNDDGDKLTLKDPSDNEIDWVAWENYVAGWGITANRGESIARITKGVDTDSVVDWEVLTSPNPGTNPHSMGDLPAEEKSPTLGISSESDSGESAESDSEEPVGEPESDEGDPADQDTVDEPDAEDDVGDADGDVNGEDPPDPPLADEADNPPEDVEDPPGADGGEAGEGESQTLGTSLESDSEEPPSAEASEGGSSADSAGEEDPESPADESSSDSEEEPPAEEPELEPEVEEPESEPEVEEPPTEDLPVDPPSDPSESEAGESNE